MDRLRVGNLPLKMEKSTKRPSFLMRHSAAFLVLSSQIVAALMHALARIVETGSGLQERVHPFTVLQVRLLITVIGCSLFLWRSRTNFLGSPEWRPLLALRAAGGVFGACGFYMSISYLSLSEATAVNFIAPIGAIILTRYLEDSKVAFLDVIASITALLGVFLVLQPAKTLASLSAEPYAYHKGIVSGIIGVAGGIVALSAMRRLGKNVHPLVSINYFGVSIFVITTIFSISMPGIEWPTQVKSWCLLATIGVLGLCMEYLLTAGLGSDNPGATIMIYSQVLWALCLDWFIWRLHINISTVLGCIVVIASLAVSCLVRELFHQKEEIFDIESELESFGPEMDYSSGQIDLK